MADAQPAAVWWGQRRRVYNLGLVFAGLAAFAAYAGIVSVRGRDLEGRQQQSQRDDDNLQHDAPVHGG